MEIEYDVLDCANRHLGYLCPNKLSPVSNINAISFQRLDQIHGCYWMYEAPKTISGLIRRKLGVNA